jgi:hypothetical protein
MHFPETGWHVILTIINVGLRGVVSDAGMDSPGAGLRKTSKLDLDNTSERTEIDIKEAALIYWGSFFFLKKMARPRCNFHNIGCPIYFCLGKTIVGPCGDFSHGSTCGE